MYLASTGKGERLHFRHPQGDFVLHEVSWNVQAPLTEDTGKNGTYSDTKQISSLQIRTGHDAHDRCTRVSFTKQPRVAGKKGQEIHRETQENFGRGRSVVILLNG